MKHKKLHRFNRGFIPQPIDPASVCVCCMVHMFVQAIGRWIFIAGAAWPPFIFSARISTHATQWDSFDALKNLFTFILQSGNPLDRRWLPHRANRPNSLRLKIKLEVLLNSINECPFRGDPTAARTTILIIANRISDLAPEAPKPIQIGFLNSSQSVQCSQTLCRSLGVS